MPATADNLTSADLEALISAARRLTSVRDPAVTAARAAREARALAGADLVGIAVRQDERIFSMLGADGEIADTFARFRLDVDFGQGLTGTILSTGLCLGLRLDGASEGVFAFDARTGQLGELVLGSAYARHLRVRLASERLVDYLAVPIAVNGEIHGILYAGMRHGDGFGTRRNALLARFAEMMAPTLEATRRARRAAVAEIARDREAIAFRLHDTIGQILFAIGTAARRGRSLALRDREAASREFATIEDETARAAAHLRQIMHTLQESPAEWTLAAELQVLAGMFIARVGVPADVIVTGSPVELPEEVLAALAAVAREGLHNVEKHSGAATVVVLLHYRNDRVTLSVLDDGRGVPEDFSLPAPMGDGSRMGLGSLARRLERVNGSIALTRRQEGGATLKAVVRCR